MFNIIGMRPILNLGMRLGEGTGAALAMNIVEAAAKIMAECKTFAEAGVAGKEHSTSTTGAGRRRPANAHRD